MDQPPVLLLVAIPLPPGALDQLGPVVETLQADTPWGTVGPVARRRVGPDDLLVLPYSGSPSRTDPRATIWAAREWQVWRILGWDTGIALSPLLRRGEIVLLDDYIDQTRRQPTVLFEDRAPGWLPPMPGFCPEMRGVLAAALPEARDGAVYLALDSSRRETASEARLYRAWGADVSGQNLVPEAALAKELGLCFGGLLIVTDVAADLPQPPARGEVREATRRIIEAIPRVIAALPPVRRCLCGTGQREGN